MRGFGGLVLLVVVVGTILRFCWVIAAAVGVVVLGVVLWKFAGWLNRRIEARERRRRAAADRLAAIARRADEQNSQVLAGDERGVYGEYAPFQRQTGEDW